MKKNRIAITFENLSEASKRSWTIPEFYEDEEYGCVDCGEASLFAAERQKEWYEIQKRYFFQRPIRCQDCHDIWRDQKKSKLHMDRKLEELKSNPENQNVMEECAFAIIDFHQKNNRGNLNMALHLLRALKAQKKNVVNATDYCKENI